MHALGRCKWLIRSQRSGHSATINRRFGDLVTEPAGEFHEKDIVGLAGEDMAEVTAEVKLTWII